MQTDDKYILVDGEVVQERDLMTWAKWYETAKRKIANTKGKVSLVSTVFLGMDHQFGDGPPMVFETLVFGGPFADEMDRYSTLDEAKAGHAAMVEKVWPDGAPVQPHD